MRVSKRSPLDLREGPPALQWFGNLVTMQWWDALWLNEGFAKHMEYVVTAHCASTCAPLCAAVAPLIPVSCALRRAVRPEWDTFAHFTANVQATAFALDAMSSTHPVEVAVSHPDQINEIFDAISYNKGASILRSECDTKKPRILAASDRTPSFAVIFDWLGHGVAFKGLHAYLKRHAHGNAVTEELWAALEEESGKRVGGVARPWTSQCGYPYVHVKTTDESAGALHRRSLRFASGRHTPAWAGNPEAWPTASDFATGPSYEAAKLAAAAWRVPGRIPDNADWSIPLSVVIEGTAGGAGQERRLDVLDLGNAAGAAPAPPRESVLAASADAVADIAADAHSHWFKLNARHAAFFRTIYDSHLIGRLLPALRYSPDRASPPALSSIDRLGLIGDVWAGVQVGMTSAADLLPVLWACRYDTDYNVWVAVVDAATGLRDAAEGVSPELGSAIERFTVALIAPVVEYVGWETRPGMCIEWGAVL